MARFLAILPDFAEERWPSMDLCAEMLAAHWPDAEIVRPPFRHTFCRIFDRRRFAFNADRLLNRFVHFPRFLKRQRDNFRFFHVVDHSYAQLVHALPAERTGVFCHDLDTFRCLLEPERDRRSRWFRALSRRILNGLKSARFVFHSTLAVRQEIERFELCDPSRLIHTPYGVSPEFAADGPVETGLAPYLLHVGSNIPRKRIDVLLKTFAGVRQRFRDLRLVKVGGSFADEQQTIIRESKLEGAIVRREAITRPEIASLYRGAAAVLLPSEAEGFGLPVIEALACGAPVLASDLPVLREVGGAAAVYLPVGDVEAWVAGTCRAIEKPHELPSRTDRLAQAAQFTWGNHARIIREAYERLI